MELKVNSKNIDIRFVLDEKSEDFYFSIVDVIEMLGLSKDSRNYWKVLKNRLNKRDNQLVTECNQLKMKSNDGKYYLTDAAKATTILKIIDIAAPEKVKTFEEIFNKIEKENSIKKINFWGKENEEEKISTGSIEEQEIKLDLYKKNDSIIVRALTVGIAPENIFISLSCTSITIKFNRIRNNIPDENYHSQELIWGKFSRTITLPYEVDIDRVETIFDHGLLYIELHITDKTRTKIIKVK